MNKSELDKFVAVQGFRVQGSKVVVHVQSESIIDKPREKPNKNRDRKVRLAPVAKNCAANLVNAYKQR